MISLVQLEYILAVDTYRHFATAAEKCFVTQPTLSMQLRKLEEQLGVKIFDRTKQPVVPTEAGKLIIEQARNIIRERDRLESIVEEVKGTIAGKLRIGVIPSLAPYLVPLFIGKLTKKYPLLELEIKELVTEDIVDQLKSDKLDAGILVTPLHEGGIKEKPLFYEGIKAYVNPDHELSKKEVITIEDLSSPNIWVLSQGHCFRHQVLNLCAMKQKNDSQLPFKYESGSLETLKRLVVKEGGFTLLPELAVNDINPNEKEFIRNFGEVNPLREVSLVVVRNFAKERLISLLEANIKSHIPEYMLDKERGQIVEWK
ncbi:hydrogen peroxide-inducible genes activator [Marinigracilibium pacificum]|uniref:Hydrogen peroxide-inducible genes activator n=1 Tax=Marinigracilibium pacificum TaxID=2729599 RepID=A0A848J397_9BACT|nr:hydrogen peroxide-inducible genes activator [Marinigracilibium pacificum]NMM48964.1 hydrogen peroxide-inducible genes activator [Marinigracilibium pacificum]